MNTIKIDFEDCTGCRTCFKVCFVDVYRYDEDSDKPIVAYPEDCVACNMCELSCPEHCIEVVPDYDNQPWPPVIERGYPYPAKQG